MAKYKLCPQCGAHVSPALIECPDCEADLLSSPVVDDADVQSAMPAAAPAALVRRCDCGHENPPQARKCSACGEDISDIPPALYDASAAPAAAPVQPQGPYLSTIDGQWTLHVCNEPVTIGRAAEGGLYLRHKPYVSRLHAWVVLTDTGLQITSTSRSNPTFVNNLPLRNGEPCLLADGDEIGLGGCVIDGQRQEGAAYLIVHL